MISERPAVAAFLAQFRICSMICYPMGWVESRFQRGQRGIHSRRNPNRAATSIQSRLKRRTNVAFLLTQGSHYAQ
jgi:hypothetical protein